LSRKAVVALVVVVLLAGAAAVYYLLNRPVESPAATDAASVSATGNYVITARDMTMGNPKAPVVLIEYAAPICPHCAHFNATVMPLLKQQYIDTGKVFYVFRVFPLQAADGVAEKLARCLPKEKYFPFMDQLFAHQQEWDPEFGVQDVRGDLLKQAQTAGMSEAQFNTCVADGSQDGAINQVAADGQSRYNIDHTPTIIVNGTPQDGGAEWDKLKSILDVAQAGK